MKAAYCISKAAVVVLNTSDITILIYNLHYERGKGLNIGCSEFKVSKSILLLLWITNYKLYREIQFCF